MKQFIYLTVLALFSSLIISCGTSSNAYLKSKNPNITWMDKKAIKKKREIPRNLSYQDDNYLYLWDDGSKKSSKKSMPIYYKVDKNTLDIVKKSSDVKKEKFNGGEVVWNQKAGWFIFDDNTKSKIDEYKVMEISLDKATPAKNLFTLESEKRKSQFTDGFGTNSDTTKLTYYSGQYISKEDKVIFDVLCFDMVTMKKLWGHRYTFPHPVKRRSDISNIDIMINKNGEPHFLSKLYFTKNKKEKRKNEDGGVEANYDFLYYVLSEAGKVEEYTVNTKGAFIESIEFPFTNQKNPVIVAYTYTKNNFRELKSIIFKQIDLDTKEVKDLKEINLNLKKLDINDGQTKIKQKKGFQEAGHLKIIDIHIADDNSIYVLGEKNVLIEKCYTDKNGVTRCYYYWQSGNILVSKISSDGKESWSKIIPKSQFINANLGANGTWKVSKCHSHASYVIGDKLHIYFNDNEKNYKTSTLKKIATWNGSKTSFVHVIVSPDGSYEMIEALGKKDHPRVVDIRKVQKIDDDHIFIYDTKTIGKLKIDR